MAASRIAQGTTGAILPLYKRLASQWSPRTYVPPGIAAMDFLSPLRAKARSVQESQRAPARSSHGSAAAGS
jgi:hypothetical protein